MVIFIVVFTFVVVTNMTKPMYMLYIYSILPILHMADFAFELSFWEFRCCADQSDGCGEGHIIL